MFKYCHVVQSATCSSESLAHRDLGSCLTCDSFPISLLYSVLTTLTKKNKKRKRKDMYSIAASHLPWAVLISAGCGLFSHIQWVSRSKQSTCPLSKTTGPRKAPGGNSDLPCCRAYYAAISSCDLLRQRGQLPHPHGSNSIRAPCRLQENTSAPITQF